MKKREFDIVLTLGDIYSHKYYKDKNEDKIWEINEYFYNKIYDNFKDKIVIPCLGNHDNDPVDYFNFED